MASHHQFGNPTLVWIPHIRHGKPMSETDRHRHPLTTNLIETLGFPSSAKDRNVYVSGDLIICYVPGNKPPTPVAGRFLRSWHA